MFTLRIKMVSQLWFLQAFNLLRHTPVPGAVDVFLHPLPFLRCLIYSLSYPISFLPSSS